MIMVNKGGENIMKRNIFIYPAIFRKEKNGYSVFIPDLKNTTCGKTLEEAIYMAKDLIGGLAVEYIDYEKKEMPVPTDISKIILEKDSDFVSLIDVDFNLYKKSLVKSVKKTVYISKELNDLAESMHINFSQTLQDALTKIVSASK